MIAVAVSRQRQADWDAYVEAHPDGWFWHTCGWLRYQVAYRQGNKNVSFMILDDDGRVVGVAPLILHSHPERGLEFTYSGDPTAVALASNEGASRVIDTELRARALTSGVRCGRFAWSPFAPVKDASPPTSQRVIDLADLKWSETRDSYKALINKATRQYTIRSDVGSLAHEDMFDLFPRYQALHAKLSTMPRPDETYRLQGEWYAGGQALVTVASDGSVDWGAAYWFIYKACAYYGSGCYAADNVSHAVVWRSLEALAAAGVKRASIGWQGLAKSNKEKAIEFFKRGFGGDDISVPIVERRW